MEIKHYSPLDGSPALEIALRGQNELLERGYLLPYVCIAGQEQALVAYCGDDIPVGVLVYQDLPYRNEWWVTLGYVPPAFRRCDIYRGLWEELIRRAKAAGRLRITGATHWENLDMRVVMERLGRKPVAVTYSYDLEG